MCVRCADGGRRCDRLGMATRVLTPLVPLLAMIWCIVLPLWMDGVIGGSLWLAQLPLWLMFAVLLVREERGGRAAAC